MPTLPLPRSLRFVTRLRAAGALLAGLLALILAAQPGRPAAAEAGGEDVPIAATTSDRFAAAPGIGLAADSLGVLFCVVEADDGAGPAIEVHRSTDGGTSWSLWGSLGDPTAGRPADMPAIAVLPRPFGGGVLPSATERVLVAHRYFDAGSGGYQLRVSDADPTQASATWFHTVAVSGVNTFDPRLATRRSLAGTLRTYVSYVDPFSNPAGSEVRFVRRVGGSPYGVPVTVFAGSAGSSLSHDIASEAGDTLHVAVVDYDAGSDVGNLQYRRSDDDGSSWTLAYLLSSLSSPTAPLVTVAASPLSNEVGIAADVTVGANPSVAVFHSDDRGVNWVANPTVPGQGSPVMAWGIDGCAMATVTQPGRQNGALLRAGAGLVSWTVENMVRRGVVHTPGGNAPSPLALASDASREGGFALAALMEAACDSLDPVEPWFDAEWRVGAGYPMREFVADLLHSTTAAPAVGDVNGNGVDDVVFPLANRLLRYESGVLDTLKTILGQMGTPALGDIDGDGDLEIFVGDLTLQLALGFDHTGAALPGWPVPLGTAPPGEIHISLRELGGVATDIVVAAGNQVGVFTPGGALRSGFPYTAPPARGGVVGRVAIGDLDAGGQPELVTAFEGGVIVLDLNGVLEQTLYDPVAAVAGGASLADLDDDFDLEIAFPLDDGRIVLLHDDGTDYGPAWPFDPGITVQSPVAPEIAFGDSDADGVRELHFQTHDQLWAVDPSGVPLPGWPVPATGLIYHEPLVQNLGQPGLQVLGSSRLGQIGAWSGPGGEPLAGYPWADCAPILLTLVTGNFDTDPAVEVGALFYQRFLVLDGTVNPGSLARTWPMSGFDAARSACAGCPTHTTTGVGESAAGPASILSTPWPNPTRAGSTLRFQLEDPASVRLEIFDVAGRRLRGLLDTHLAAGRHETVWDGLDESGREAAPGIYFIRLDVETGPKRITESRKFTILR